MMTSFKTYGIFLVIAIFIGLVLLSDRIWVNITHHHKLPQVSETEKLYCSGILTQTCHVRLSTAIGKPEKYRRILHAMAQAGYGDTIYIYLRGNGGRVDSTIQIYNAIKNSKAKIVTVVEGDVYSAHAMIAAMGDEIKVGKYLLFMIHTSSAYGSYEEYCAKKFIKVDGTHVKDRTQSLYQKCMDIYRARLLQTNAMIHELYSRLLTAEELRAIYEGHDLLLTGEQFNQRLRGVK